MIRTSWRRDFATRISARVHLGRGDEVGGIQSTGYGGWPVALRIHVGRARAHVGAWDHPVVAIEVTRERRFHPLECIDSRSVERRAATRLDFHCYHARVDPHRLAEERSIAMHEAIASKLRADPGVITRAQARVEQWRDSGAMHPRYAEAWSALLAGPVDDLCALLVDPSEHARALRQCTPFVGALTPAERWNIWRAVGEAVERASE